MKHPQTPDKVDLSQLDSAFIKMALAYPGQQKPQVDPPIEWMDHAWRSKGERQCVS